MIAVDLVAAAKTGDQTAFATHDARWTANIERDRRFLAGANPNWPERDVLDLLALHLKLTKDETVARIGARLGGRRQGVRRHLHRDHGRRRHAPRRHRRAVPGAVRRRSRAHDRASRWSRRRAAHGRRWRSARRGPRSRGCSGTDGATPRLLDASPTATALVLVFSSNRCPTAKAYGERLNALQRDVRPDEASSSSRINANDPHLYPDESYPRMVDRAREDGYTFPYLVDEGQRVAPRVRGDAARSTSSCSTGERRLRYEGRFDDSRIAGAGHDATTSRNALDDLLAGAPSGSRDAAVRLQPRPRVTEATVVDSSIAVRREPACGRTATAAPAIGIAGRSSSGRSRRPPGQSS